MESFWLCRFPSRRSIWSRWDVFGIMTIVAAYAERASGSDVAFIVKRAYAASSRRAASCGGAADEFCRYDVYDSIACDRYFGSFPVRYSYDLAR